MRATHLEEINHIKNTYEIQLGELREKAFELGNQLHASSSENEVIRRDRLDELHRELAEKTKQIDNLSTIVKYLRTELKPLYDKHMKSHYKSFDNKSTER